MTVDVIYCWLIERGSPPVYVEGIHFQLTPDAWKARRWDTKAEAENFCRMMAVQDPLYNDARVCDHGFTHSTTDRK
ncbi:MAG: hypothetical protein ACXWHZ_03650 [Usitatibacter sp.]